MAEWDPRRLPGAHGRRFAVTGATAGIGYFVAEQLAQTGAHVVLVGRSPDRLARARTEISRRVPGARLGSVRADLGDQDSVRRAGEELVAAGRLDGLVANAGLVRPPRERRTTIQGFELAMGTNHLGHVALLAAVLPALLATPGSRVVSSGSYLTRQIPFDPDDLMSERSYHPRRAYAQSKHATEIFGFELDRRLRQRGADCASLVAHPGGALDALTPRRPGIAGAGRPLRALAQVGAGLAQGKDRGAWPLVRALLDPEARGGEYHGPARRTHGRPVVTDPVDSSTDTENGARVWDWSLAQTGRDLL